MPRRTTSDHIGRRLFKLGRRAIARKRQAHVDLNNALKLGKIVKPATCSKCSAARPEAHHPDYSKPLEVVWLCRIHHVEAHRVWAF